MFTSHNTLKLAWPYAMSYTWSCEGSRRPAIYKHDIPSPALQMVIQFIEGRGVSLIERYKFGISSQDVIGNCDVPEPQHDPRQYMFSSLKLDFI